MMIYETTDIKLGAVILSEILEARILGADSDRLINSKKVLKIEYPEERKEEVNKIIKNYTQKIQLINVYDYNRNLNTIRNIVFNRV